MKFKIYKINPKKIDVWIDNYASSVKVWHVIKITEEHFNFMVKADMGYFLLGKDFLNNKYDHFFVPKILTKSFQGIQLIKKIPNNKKAIILLTYTSLVEELMHYYSRLLHDD